MNARQRYMLLFIAGLLVLTVPAVLLATEPAASASEPRVVIVHDDGDEVVIDVQEVHAIVAEAMEGMDEMLAELEDMQLQVRLGRDNRLDLSFEDTTFELDLDQIMTQVAAAVQTGFDEFDTDEWTHAHDRWSHASNDDLRDELEELKQEMKELRRELRKARDANGD